MFHNPANEKTFRKEDEMPSSYALRQKEKE